MFKQKSKYWRDIIPNIAAAYMELCLNMINYAAS